MITLRRLVILSLLALFLSSPSLPAAKEENGPTKVRVGAYENRPKIFTGRDGEFVGIFPDLLGIAATSEGWELEYVPGTWTECLARLEKGEIDVMPDVAYSRTREETYDFSDETVFINWGVIYVREGVEADSFLDLEGKTVAVMKGSIHTVGEGGIQQILRAFNIESHYVEAESYQGVFELLDSGRADAGVVNRLFGSLHEVDYGVRKTTLIFNPRHLKFAFPKGSSKGRRLKTGIDGSLRRLREDIQSPYYAIIDTYLAGEVFQAEEEKEPSSLLSPEEAAWIREHPEIRLGVDPEFMPFEFLTRDGTYSGIASDYIEILNESLGLNMVVIPGITWSQAVDGAKKGEVDVLPCVGVTGERGDFLLFSRPYIKFHRVIITRTDTPFITGIDDLEDMKVAVQEKSSHEGYIREKTGLWPLLYPTLEQAILAVADGEADALVGNIASATYWIRTLNLTNLKVAAPVDSEVRGLHFAVRRDWPELVKILNKGLAAITPEKANAIHRRWVSVQYTPGIAPAFFKKTIARIIVVAFFVLALSWIWSFSLKREISKRRQVEEKLQASSAFERLLSEISSHFIGLTPDEVDSSIEKALADIAGFTGADAAYLFCFDDGGQTVSCTHRWLGERLPLNRSSWEGLAIGPDWKWLDRLRRGEAWAGPMADSEGGAGSFAKDFLADRGVLFSVEIPREYRGEGIGFFGLSFTEGQREWSREESGLLTLAGEIFTNALLRKEGEVALADSAEKLSQKANELERSQKALTFLLEDVNEAKEEVEGANRKLKELDRLKSMFIASMSHELRTPLNSIIGFTGIILQGMAGEINEEQKDQLQRIYGSGKHLLSLITDVIDISKIEAGKIEPYIEEVRLGDVLAEALSNVQTQAKEKGLTITLDAPGEMVMHTDRKRILQCVLNYMSNAVKYSEKGDVKVSARLEGERVAISVVDQGIGITAEDLSKLFGSFVRLDSPLKVLNPGTGLGLYLTRKLATEVLGGDVAAESTPGVGSTFTLSVPQNLKEARERA